MMKWRLNFRQRIVAGFLVLSLFFILIVYPFVGWVFLSLSLAQLKERIEVLIEQLQKMPSESQMVDHLDKIHPFLFYHPSLFNDRGEMIFDAAVLARKQSYTSHPLAHSQMQAVLEKGLYEYEEYSEVFEQKLMYVMISFQNNGKYYVLRAEFPYAPMEEVSHQIKTEFLITCFVALLFFIGCFWLLFHRINYPIRQIIKAVLPFQTGQEEFIAPIVLPKSIDGKDKFYQLAGTLNALSERIRTQIKQIMEERNEKEAVLESLGEGVIAIDRDMRIRYANYIGARMLGFPRKQLAGKSFKELGVHGMSPLLEKCCHLLETCQNKMTILTDSIFIADGKKIYIDLIAAPKPMQNGAILVLQDKSSHYKVLEMGKDFVANASHELRTPITIIRGFAETLHDLPELPREMVSDITEKIVRNCQRMDNLVKNLLTLADLENIPESRFQECDLVALIENCRHMVLSVYEDAQIRIEKSKEAITVDADPDILELAIINLMDNAAKYSTPPAQISIKIDEIGNEAQIVIADKGIGIPAEDIEHIFERFYTVNKAHSRRLGGAGLGLSIVRTIIEKHHGSITVSSILRQGTIFTVLLPIHRSSIF